MQLHERVALKKKYETFMYMVYFILIIILIKVIIIIVIGLVLLDV